MINVIGLSTDPTICHFADYCRQQGIKVRTIDLAEMSRTDWIFNLPAGKAFWSADGRREELPVEEAWYVRPIDLSAVAASRHEALAWRSVLAGLSAWLETLPGCVINRPGHVVDNASKPLHEALLMEMGFMVPPSITSSDLRLLAQFSARQPTIVKSISGVRANCQLLKASDLVGFDRRSGPVHLQKLIKGVDVRAHVVGNAVISVTIDCEEVDYRTSDKAIYLPIRLPHDLEKMMVSCAKAMNLSFSGWDFKLDQTGIYWLLEVNPMPGYHVYDRHLDGRISRALADEMMGVHP